MPPLSPAKLLVVALVALIVLGPDKLPRVARQAGAMWSDLRRWRARLEEEVRGSFPDLPPTHHITEMVRSPISYLDRLADQHEEHGGADDTTVGPGPPGGPAPGQDGGGPEHRTDPGRWAPVQPGQPVPGPVPSAEPGSTGRTPGDPNLN